MIGWFCYLLYYTYMNRFLRGFLPHASNDYLPDYLQRTALALMGMLVVISFTMSNVYALLWQQSNWLVGAVLPAVIVSETNGERDVADLPALVRSPILDEAARLKAEDMAARGYFAHYSPEGVSPWHWFNQVNYPFVHAGENLAVHFTDSKEVVEAWMHSPTHRANIVNNNYREIGVGTAKGRFEGYDTVFVVQLFGTPAAMVVTDDLTPIAVLPEPTASVVVEDALTMPAQVAGAEIDLMESDKVTTADTPPLVVDTIPAVEESGAVLYLDTVATSTNLPEAPHAVPAEMNASQHSLATLATSPSTLLQRIYLGLGLLAIVLLVLSVLVEWRHQRPRQVLYGVTLLCLMSVLFYVHTMVTGGSLII